MQKISEKNGNSNWFITLAIKCPDVEDIQKEVYSNVS